MPNSNMNQFRVLSCRNTKTTTLQRTQVIVRPRLERQVTSERRFMTHQRRDVQRNNTTSSPKRLFLVCASCNFKFSRDIVELNVNIFYFIYGIL